MIVNILEVNFILILVLNIFVGNALAAMSMKYRLVHDAGKGFVYMPIKKPGFMKLID